MRPRFLNARLTDASIGWNSRPVVLADRRGLGKLQRGVVGLAGTDADDALDVGDENLAVADLAGLGRLEDGLDHLIGQVAANGHLDPGLGHKIHHIFSAAVQLGMAALTTKSLYFRDSHSRNADIRERGAHVVELERLDDCGDQFHVVNSPSRYLWAMLRRLEHFCSFHATGNENGKSSGFQGFPRFAAVRYALL